MRHKALIVESSGVFKSILEKIMDTSGIDCNVYSNAAEALEGPHGEYTFIIVSRVLDDMSSEAFLSLYREKHGLGRSLTILMIGGDINPHLVEANNAGFKLVCSKTNLESLQTTVVDVINKLTLDLAANVLLVEDSQSVANVISLLLKSNGSNVKHISRLKDLAGIFNAIDFDIVITDYHLMDGETGDDVISFVRNHECETKSNTPILVVSGETNKEKRISFLRNGANDFIIKPYDNDELIVRSSNLIRGGKLLRQVEYQKQKLTELALFDQLSGLYNRHSLHDLAPKYISNSKRHQTPLSLLVIDLDHFKIVNDTRGHSVGDIVLKSVSAVLQESCRTEDMVARFGGEEFVMLLANCDIHNACDMAERLRCSVESIEPEGLVITSSIGVSELMSQDTDFDSLFERADKAVYKAKECGRNRVVSIPNEGITPIKSDD